MKERVIVFVDERPVEVFRGMKVKHALIAADVALFKACSEGRVRVENQEGFLVGLDGALSEGTRLLTKEIGKDARCRHD
jgi:hypothetical protein